MLQMYQTAHAEPAPDDCYALVRCSFMWKGCYVPACADRSEASTTYMFGIFCIFQPPLKLFPDDSSRSHPRSTRRTHLDTSQNFWNPLL